MNVNAGMTMVNCLERAGILYKRETDQSYVKNSVIFEPR